MSICFQAQSDDDDVADDVSVNVGGPDDFMTEFFAEVSITINTTINPVTPSLLSRPSSNLFQPRLVSFLGSSPLRIVVGCSFLSSSLFETCNDK